MKTRFRDVLVAVVALAAISETDAGTVFPIATNGAVSQAAWSAASDGTNYLVGIQGDAVVHDNITAQLVSPGGALLGPRIATGRSGGLPQVSFGGTNFLLLWSDVALYAQGLNIGVLYGQVISRSGALVGTPFPISATNANAGFGSFQCVAFDGRTHCVVWTDASGPSAPASDAYAALIRPDGALTVGQTLLSTNAYLPAVAFGNSSYLAVWQSRRATGPELYDTYGEFVSTNGAPGAGFSISQTPSLRYNPLAVAFDGTAFLVVWNKDVGPGYPSPAQWTFYGRRVLTDGTFAGNEVALVTDANNPVFPALAFDGVHYLLTWHGGTTNSQVYLRFFDPSPAPVGPAFTLFSPSGTNQPVIGQAVFSGARFFVTAVIGGGGGGEFTGSTETYGAFIPGSTVAPLLTVGRNRTTQGFPLLLTGTPGINYSIEASANVDTGPWTAVVTNTPLDGTFSFTDTPATNGSRFYRAVSR